MKLTLGILLSFTLCAQIPKPGGGNGGGSGAAAGTANQVCSFSAGATSCTITYASTVTDASIATDPSCVFTNNTPNVAFEWGSVTKSTTASIVTFTTAPNAGKCSVNLTGGTAPGAVIGVGTVTNNTGNLDLDLPLFGGGGADAKVGTKSGNTNTVVSMGAGTPATNDCAKFDANHNLVSAGAACGTGNGGGVGNSTVNVGTGLSGDGSVGTPLVIDPLVVPTRLSATATLQFASVAQSACDEKNITLLGAVVQDEVMVGAPNGIEQGFLWSAYVAIADTIKVRICKITTGTVTPASAIWRATIVRSM